MARRDVTGRSMANRAMVARLFVRSAGLLLVATAAMIFIGERANAGRTLPADPIFDLSNHHFSDLASGVMMFVGLISLISEKSRLAISLLAWLTLNFWCYRVGMAATGFRNSGPYIGQVANAFGMNAGASAIIADIFFGVLLTGSCILLFRLICRPTKPANPPARTGESIKIACPACAGHLEFHGHALGQKIPCQHCQTEVTLRKLET